MFISHSYPVPKRRAIAVDDRAGVIGSIRKGEDRHEAVRLIKEGFPVGIFVRSVAIISLDGTDPNAVDKIYGMKSERRGDKPMATILPAKVLAGLIDSLLSIPSPYRLHDRLLALSDGITSPQEPAPQRGEPSSDTAQEAHNAKTDKHPGPNAIPLAAFRIPLRVPAQSLALGRPPAIC